MALTRGPSSSYPCPICLVVNKEITDFTKTWPLRTAAQVQEVIQEARSCSLAGDCEEKFASQSLKNVDVSKALVPFLSLFQTHLILTYRMCSGVCSTQMYIVHFPLIGSIPTTVDFLAITSGRHSSL